MRVPPPVFGVGLLAAIPKEAILSQADPHDANNDGISGRANFVWNEKTEQMELGRFGWKANVPTVLQQVAAAYHQDMGITSPYYPNESIYQNPDAKDGLNDDPEISKETLMETVFYVKTLGVPAKRTIYPTKVLRRGEKLFHEAGCASCHTPQYTTKSNTKIPALANQTIYPYTDLLLHDMGPGLADHRPDGKANGREWRTPPLWGIGLSKVVNGHVSYLHDGRAQSILEAILWHGGEAAQSRAFVKQLPKKDRRALIKFVKSL